MAAYTIEQYKNAARKAKAAGNLKAAEELAQAGIALQNQNQQTPVKPTGDTSMGTAFKVGDAGAVAAATAGSSVLNRQLENSAVGRFFRNAQETIGNPVRSLVGADPIDPNAVQNRLDKAADASSEYLEQLQKDLNFQNLETSDIKDLGSFVNYVGQKVAQAAPYMGSALASGGFLTVPFGVGEVDRNLDEIEGLDRQTQDNIATAGGLIMAALETLGIAKLLPKGTSNKILGGIVEGVITEGVTEGMQELVAIGSEAVAGKEFAEGEILNRLKESAAAGAVAGGSFKGGLTTGAKVKSLFTSDGKIKSPDDLSNLPESEKFAAADVARLIDETSKANGYKLKNVDPSSNKGAKQALEDVRSSNVQAINDLRKVLKKQLDPKNAQSLEQLLSVYSEASAGIGAGKKKVSQKVTEKQIQAIQQLVGNTKEGQQLVQELVKSNVITNLFKDGMKGGISQFTDLFNPISHSGAVYDPTRYANVFIGGTSAYGTGGLSLGIAAGGRVVDFFTGRRSKVSNFVKKNRKALGLPDPQGTSLIEQKAKQKAAAKDRRAAIAQIATILDAPKAGFVENILLGTGLDRSGLETVLNNMASDFGSNPDFVAILDDIQTNLDGEGVAYLDNLSEIIPVIGAYAQAYSPELVTNTPDNPLLKRSFDSPNVQTDMPTMGGGGSQFGAQFAPQENYNRGIQDNLDFVRTLQEGAGKDKEVSRVDRGRLITSLENLKNNLGSNPVETVQTEVQKLQDQGVNQDAIDKYVQPYVDRVIRQQRPKGLQAAADAGVAPDVDTDAETLGQKITNIFNRNKDPDSKLSQTLDLQSLSPKKPQAPTLEPSEIPTETRKVYKLMKVQPSRPNELLPLYAKSGESGKGSPSGYRLNTWHKAESQRPMIGGKMLADRAGIHGVNLPVFDQGKAKVKGEQRVWVEVEIPAISPDTQLESDNSPVLQNNMREGIKNRLIGTKESYDYKTNPNASNDAGGWPIAGSMRALRIVPDNEIAQILRDNGLDHQIDNSFTDVNEAKAQELMGTPEAEPAARLQMGLPLFENPLPIDGKVTVKKIGEAMHNDHMTKVGRKLFPEENEADYNIVLDYARQELAEQLKQPNSGVGWYSKDVDDAIKMASRVYPTLATNQQHRQLYLTFAGIFSNGTDPDNAFMMSSMAFDDFLRTGEIPTNRAQGFYDQGLEPPKTTFKSAKTGKMVTKDAGWGIRNQANEQQLGLLKYLVETKGDLKSAMDFLLTPQKRSDINDVMLDSGLYKAGRFTTKKEKEGADEYGFLAFGKKLGRYSLGLHGVDVDAGDTTIDLWYTRTFRRWTGRLLDTPVGKEGVAAMPANDQERDTIFRLTGDLVKENPDLTVGDVQALLWFFEKRTWGSQGLNVKEGTNSSGARKLLQERGIDPDQNDDGTRSDGSGSQPSPTPEQPRLSGGILSRLASSARNLVSAPSQREFDFGRTLPSNQEFKSQTELANVPFEVGKKGSKYENGLKDYDSLRRLAEAYMITLKAYKSQRAMAKDNEGTTKGTAGVFNPEARSANYLVAGVKLGDTRVVEPNHAYMTALHEVVHGIASARPDGYAGGQGQGMRDTGIPEVKRLNYLNLRNDPTYEGTFEDEIAKLLDVPDADKTEIISEIINLQDAMSFMFPDGTNLEVRDLSKAKRFVAEKANEIDQAISKADADDYVRRMTPLLAKHQQYTRGVYEMSVDPIIFYLYNPKEFRAVAPKTAKMIRDFFKESSTLQFYNHPLALGVAVVLAMLLKQEQADEEDQQRGILAQRAMQAGALTA